MIAVLKNLMGLAAREDATAEEIAPSLPEAEAALEAAHEAFAAAETAYRSSLLRGDDATSRKLVDARTDAGVRVDRAEALVTALRGLLEAAQARESEAVRVTAYEAARAQAEEARALLVEIYPQLALDLVSLMGAVANAEIAVAAVNADLPAGAAPLPDVEHTVRSVPRVPETVLSETRVERWVEVGRIQPGSFRQDIVHSLGRGRGVIRIDGVPLTECRQVELRGFTEQRVLPSAPPVFCYELAKLLSLPPLRADEQPYWQPLEHPSPRQVLEKLLARATAVAQPPRSVEAVTRLVPDPGARPVEGERSHVD